MKDNLRKRTQPPSTPNNEPEPVPKKKAKSNAQKQREYRERMRLNNPEKFAQVLEHQKKRSDINRISVSLLPDDDERKQRSKELNNLRVAKCRQKRKDQESEVKSKPKKRTRAETELLQLKRENDRVRKQKERDAWSRQKRTAENKKAKDRRLLKKLEMIESKSVATSTCDNQVVLSEPARKQALYRVKKALPKDASKKEVILSDLLHGVKRTERQDPADNMLKKLVSTKKGRKYVLTKLLTDQDRQVRLISRKYFNISRQLAFWYRKKDSLKARSNSSKRGIVERYIIQHSQPMGGKKSLYRGTPKRLLHRNITDLHASFVKEHFKISLSFFCKVRRCMRFCVSAAKQAYNQTLCELCENVCLKIKAMKDSTASFPVQDVYRFVDSFTCNRTGQFHAARCIEGTCDDCPKPFPLSETDKAKTIGYLEWRNVTVGGKKRKIKKYCEATAQDVLQTLLTTLTSFRQHLFTARWQYSNFLDMKQKLTDGDVMMVMDFSENYRCAHQDEIQSAYWSYEQATIHPTVCYYPCSSCDTMVTESVVAISDDMQHDSHAVDTFFEVTVAHLKKKGVSLKNVIQFTDGCGVQYKSKIPFAKIAGCKEFSVERHYFGTGHGKNPSDGESAVIKTKAARTVKCRQAMVQTAEELFSLCEASLTKDDHFGGDCNHYRRSFIYVPSHDIKRDVPDVQTVKGTRKVHWVKAAGDGMGIWTRNLSCGCGWCGPGIQKEDCKATYMADWKYHQVLKTVQPNASVDDLDLNDTGLSDILTVSMLEQVEVDIGSNIDTSLQNTSSGNLAYVFTMNGTPEINESPKKATNTSCDISAAVPMNGMPEINESPKKAPNTSCATNTSCDISAAVPMNGIPEINESPKKATNTSCDISAAVPMNGIPEVDKSHCDATNAPCSDASKKVIPGLGEYVKCVVRSKDGIEEKMFNGVVSFVDFDNSEVKVNFMKGDENKGYVFPQNEDTSWVP